MITDGTLSSSTLANFTLTRPAVQSSPLLRQLCVKQTAFICIIVLLPSYRASAETLDTQMQPAMIALKPQTTFSAPIPLCPILYATLVCSGKNSNLSSEQRRKSVLFLFRKLSPSSPLHNSNWRDIKQARGHEVLSGAKLNRLSWRSLPCWHQQRSVALLHVLRVLRRPSDQRIHSAAALCNSVTCCTLTSILHSSQELSPQIEAFDALPCCSGGHNCEVKLIGHAWQSRTIQRIHRGPIIKGRSITLS